MKHANLAWSISILIILCYPKLQVHKYLNKNKKKKNTFGDNQLLFFFAMFRIKNIVLNLFCRIFGISFVLFILNCNHYSYRSSCFLLAIRGDSDKFYRTPKPFCILEATKLFSTTVFHVQKLKKKSLSKKTTQFHILEIGHEVKYSVFKCPGAILDQS